MDKRKLKKLRRYSVKGNIFVVLGAIIAAFIAIFEELDELTFPEFLIIVIITVLLGGGLYLVGKISVSKRFKQRVKELEANGTLAMITEDFSTAERAFCGKIAFGKISFAIKGFALIYLYSEVDNMFVTDLVKESDCCWLGITVNGQQMTILEVSEKKLNEAQRAVEIFNSRKNGF